MSAKTRFMQRFLGAVTLVAILVIFLPMLFNKRQYNMVVHDVDKNTVEIPNVKEPNNFYVESWVLKIKTFVVNTDAVNLNRHLVQKKYASFVAKDLDGKFVVYVGPELKKENIEKIQQDLKTKLKISADIVQYDPLTM